MIYNSTYNQSAEFVDVRRGGGRNSPGIYGVRVTGNGEVLDTRSSPICLSTGPHEWPTVASNGKTYVVAWQIGRRFGQADVEGTVVFSDGRVPAEATAISNARWRQRWPAVASDDSGYYVVWTDFRDSSSKQIYGRPLSASGEPIDTEAIMIHSNLEHNQ